MKILMLIDSLVRGGRERRLLELLKGLKQYENVTTELVLFSRKVEYPEVHNMNIPIHYLERNPKKDPRVFFRFYQLCKEKQPDIIHSWGTMPTIYAIPTAKFLGIKLINANIADAPKDMTWLDKRLFRAHLTFPFSDIIIGNSNAGLKAYNAPIHKSKCVYNGFDFRRLNKMSNEDAIRAELKITTKKVVGMVGRFFDHKDYQTYLDAAFLTLEKRKDVTFLCLGDGPFLAHFKNYVPKALKHNIIFTGMLDDVESVVNLFDVGVLCTNTAIISEGISNSIIEYMVLGKPVIATEGGGTNEIIVDGKTGFLTLFANAKFLADKMQILIDNEELAKKMGQAGKERIYQHFSLERMRATYFELYQQMTRGSGAAIMN
ncbi:MAG: glycosyltransferase [Bacteroidota bacterium]